jgi:dihydroxy-acid dehydratase
MTPGSFHNAIVTLAAIGGSTNAVVHLLAIAGRLGVPLTLDDFDRVGADVPLLVDLQPAGRHLMEDLYRAGGLAAVLREVAERLDPDAITVTGEPFVSGLAEAQIWDNEVIRSRDEPLQDKAGIAVLYGNLAPAGAIIKPAAASPNCCATAVGRWSSTPLRTFTPGSTIRSSTWTPTPCWFFGVAAPRATPACPRCRTCRCRRSCSNKGYVTWCASATAA